MSQNIGTLVSAAIRPNDSLDPIASAFATEIKGGLHTSSNLSNRNSIILERREWGMMCYVVSEDKTYQLKYGISSNNLMDNFNWVEFSGYGGGSTEWLDSVLTVSYSQPSTPSNGDRYLVGLNPISVVTGASWSTVPPGFIAEWNASLSRWDYTIPTQGTTVTVDDQDNAIYRYEGNYPTGGWERERLQQIINLTANTGDGQNYFGSSSILFSNYTQDVIFLVKFTTTNTSSPIYLDVDGVGSIQIKKPTGSGLFDLDPSEIITNVIYSLTFDGTYFQSVKPFSDSNALAIKYYIGPLETVLVPQYYQYWVWGDLTVAGQIFNYGHVIIANGNLVLSGGTFSNLGSGQLALVNLSTSGTASVQFSDSDTIDFQTINTITGVSASATIKPNSLTASLLNTGVSGGATAGYILSNNGDGTFKWVDNVNINIGTQSGLTYSLANELVVSYDNNTIQLNSQGQLFVAGGGSSPIYDSKFSLPTTGDNQPTGLTLSNIPTSYSSILVFVNGQLQTLGDGISSGVDCYFSDGFTTKSFINLVAGDELYWNGIFSNFDLDTQDYLQIIYES